MQTVCNGITEEDYSIHTENQRRFPGRYYRSYILENKEEVIDQKAQRGEIV